VDFLKSVGNSAEELFRSFFSFFFRPSLSERLVITGALVGTAAGFASYIFIRAIHLLSHWTIERLPQHLSFWHDVGYLFFPALGTFLGYILIRFFCPEAHGYGTKVLNILPEKSPWLAARIAVVKLIASALTIGLGGSAGQEGPVIQIGGATASFLGKYLRVPDEDIRVLIAAGAAAGLGASFGAPLAAVFFIMEVTLKDFASSLFSSIVIASVSGAVTSRLLMGDVDFVVGFSYTWSKPSDLLVYALVGLLCAPLGILYKMAVAKMEKHCEEEKSSLSPYLFPILGGVLVGEIALFYPEVLGTGKQVVDAAFMGGLSGFRMGVVAFAKIAATALTLGTGGSGGAFMPAIFIGAAAGASLSGVLSHLFAKAALARGSFAITGMASVITSSYRAPITGIIMALEMSRDYGIVMPVMAACAVSFVAVSAVERGYAANQ
jgi:CIC family chloride channel protein